MAGEGGGSGRVCTQACRSCGVDYMMISRDGCRRRGAGQQRTAKERALLVVLFATAAAQNSMLNGKVTFSGTFGEERKIAAHRWGAL